MDRSSSQKDKQLPTSTENLTERPELTDDYIPLDLSVLSPINEEEEEEESEFFEENEFEDQNNDIIDGIKSDIEDDLQNLEEMVNFKISEILPTGMTPLDNSRSCPNDCDEPAFEKTSPVSREQNEVNRNVEDESYSASLSTPKMNTNKTSAQTKSPKSILKLTEMALKEHGCLTVRQICDWLNLFYGDVRRCEDLFPNSMARNQEQRWRRQDTVESVLNCYPQFLRISQEGSEDSWVLARTEGEQLAERRPAPKVTPVAHTNHWKKQKLAEYRRAAPCHTVSPMLDQTSGNQLLWQTPNSNEPLDLVVRKSEPLNLTTETSADANVKSDSTKPDETKTDLDQIKKQDRSTKVIKKIFSKLPVGSGQPLWRLKNKKSKRRSISKANLREKVRRKQKKKDKAIKAAALKSHKEKSNTRKTGKTSNLVKDKPENAQDTKIKLIKVGDSYKIAASSTEYRKEDSNSEATADTGRGCDSYKIAASSTEYKEEDSSREVTAVTGRGCEVDKSPKQEGQGKVSSCTSAGSVGSMKSGGTVVATSGFMKPVPFQPMQMITVTKREVKDGVTIERKPVWIQIPTSTGGTRILPLVVPQKCQERMVSTASLTNQPYVSQVKGQTKPTNNYRSKSGFPHLTEFNRRRKVFKIGEDGTISCLGTLEEVAKSGLLGNNLAAQSTKESENRVSQKVVGNIKIEQGLGSQLKAASVEKRRILDEPDILDLSKKIKLSEWPTSKIDPASLLEIRREGSEFSRAQSVKSLLQAKRESVKQNLIDMDKVINKPTRNLVESSDVRLKIKPSIMMESGKPRGPLQTNTNFTNSNRNDEAEKSNASSLQSNKVQCSKREEESESKPLSELTTAERMKRENKIRSKIKNKIKESYHRKSEKITSTKFQSARHLDAGGSTGKFQAPFGQLYAAPADHLTTANLPPGPPAYYYPARWQTRHPYPSSNYGVFNPTAMTYGHSPAASSFEQPKQNKNLAACTFVPSHVPVTHAVDSLQSEGTRGSQLPDKENTVDPS